MLMSPYPASGTRFTTVLEKVAWEVVTARINNCTGQALLSCSQNSYHSLGRTNSIDAPLTQERSIGRTMQILVLAVSHDEIIPHPTYYIHDFETG